MKKLRGFALSLILSLVLTAIPSISNASGPVANILFYSGVACGENSSQRIYFCLDFRNASEGYDVDFNGEGMRFDWSVATAGVTQESGGSLVRYKSRTVSGGPQPSYGFHRQEVNGLSSGTSYDVTMTVDNGGEITVKTLTVQTTGSKPSSAPPSSDSSVGTAGAISVKASSQMKGGDSLTVIINVKDLAGSAMVGKTVTLFSTGMGSLSSLTLTTDLSGNASVEFTAPSAASGFSTIIVTVDSLQESKSIEILPESGTKRFGGYAIVHPSTGQVCGVIVGNGAGSSVTSNEFMGCPVGSLIVFQTKPSPTGNVTGWHGSDVFYVGGTFYLPGGTTITDGIATDSSGRVWDTGTGETLVQGQPPEPVAEGGASSSSSTASGATESEAVAGNPEAPEDEPAAEGADEGTGIFSTVAVDITVDGAVITVQNAIGRKLSAKIAGRWLVETVDSSPFVAFRPLIQGTSLLISVWLDGKFVTSKNITSGQQSTGSAVLVGEETSTASQPASKDTTESSDVLAVQAQVESVGNILKFSIQNAVGKKVSIRIGGRWVVAYPTSNTFVLSTISLIGQEVSLTIYVDGLEVGSSTILTGESGFTALVDEAVSSSQSLDTSSSSPATESVASRSSDIDVATSDSSIFITATNAEGRKLSVKIGGRWLVVYPDSNPYTLKTPSVEGASVAVSVYIDAVFVQGQTITVLG
jgi:hypothetical protein